MFEELFRKQFLHLCYFAAGYVGDMEISKEIVQEVFLNLWQNRQNIDPSGQIKSYLFTSVKNRCLNHIRDNKKFTSRLLDIELIENESVEPPDDMAVQELHERYQNVLGKLPEKCREVFELNRMSGLKYREVADRLGISVKTVEVQMSKALKILREELRDYLLFVLLWIFECF